VPEVRPQDQVSEFIVVDVKQDVDAAVVLTRLVLLEIFRLNPRNNVTVWFRNISIQVEKIGFCWL